jgi:hypothetical protein
MSWEGSESAGCEIPQSPFIPRKTIPRTFVSHWQAAGYHAANLASPGT